MRNIPTPFFPQAAEKEVAARLIAGGYDARLIRAAICLIKRGSADLIDLVLAGKISVAQAVAMARGRS